MKAYEHFVGEHHPGPVKLDPVANNIAKWLEAGETRKTLQNMLDAFFQSEKAKKITITPNSVFSDHTYISWKQNKL